MKNFLSKASGLIFLFAFNALAFAQPVDPSLPGVGGSGTGSRSSSIDMYAIILVIIAVIFAIYFAKNYVKQLSK